MKYTKIIIYLTTLTVSTRGCYIMSVSKLKFNDEENSSFSSMSSFINDGDISEHIWSDNDIRSPSAVDHINRGRVLAVLRKQAKVSFL